MKVTASLTEKRSYHNAMIDGEAPEMLDPQDNIGSDIGPGDAIKAGLASLQGQAAAGALPTLQTEARCSTFSIRKKCERGTTGTQSMEVGWKEFDRVPRPPKTVDTRSG